MQEPIYPSVLYMTCGKIASGKTSLCRELSEQPRTVVIAQDHWMSNLYREELREVADYLRLVPRLHSAMEPHVVDLLRAGISVVLDWPANTVSNRAWMRRLYKGAGAGHQLHFLDVPDAICLARLHARNRKGCHPYNVSDAQYAEITSLFEPPELPEGFNLIVHGCEQSSIQPDQDAADRLRERS